MSDPNAGSAANHINLAKRIGLFGILCLGVTPLIISGGIDLSIGTWRGLAAPKGTPPDVLAVLTEATRKSADEPVLRDALDPKSGR